MSYQSPIHVIQGKRFQQKPTTRKNEAAFTELAENPSADFLAMNEEGQYLEMLRYVVDPLGDASFDDLDADDLGKKQVEAIVSGFLPSLARTIKMLTAFSG